MSNETSSQTMKYLKSSENDLRNIFENALTVAHISESLVSKDVSDPAAEARTFMEERNFDEIGVSQDGKITGFVKRSELAEGLCDNFVHEFALNDLIADSTSLFQAFQLLRNQSRYFVLSSNDVAGIVTRGDLQKAPVRMFLFSLITLVEMRLLKAIRDFYPNNKWQGKLNKKRLEGTQNLLKERQKRNEDIDLADCLQLGDKFDLIRQSDRIMQEMEVSKHKLKKLKSKIEGLRNHLAHGNDLIIGFSWEELFEITSAMQKLLTQLEKVTEFEHED